MDDTSFAPRTLKRAILIFRNWSGQPINLAKVCGFVHLPHASIQETRIISETLRFSARICMWGFGLSFQTAGGMGLKSSHWQRQFHTLCLRATRSLSGACILLAALLRSLCKTVPTAPSPQKRKTQATKAELVGVCRTTKDTRYP